MGRATFGLDSLGFSPLGETGEGFYRRITNMPIKNIITSQKVSKEKLQRAKELRRDMTPAEKILVERISSEQVGRPFSETANY